MQTHFHTFSTWVPDGWLDQSSITFCMPASDELQAPLSLGKAQTHSPANFVVTWEPIGQQNLEDYGRQRLAKLKAALPNFHLFDQGLWQQNGQNIYYGEYDVHMAPPLTQLLQIKTVGPNFVCLTGTAIKNNYAEVKKYFQKSMLALRSKEQGQNT